MNWCRLVLFFILGVFLVAANSPAEEALKSGAPADYQIGPGDVLEISVWRNDELTRLVTVLPDGKISFPLIGELVAGGKSTAELKQEIEGKIERFVPDPTLYVSVQQMNSMLIYVIGRVNNPGRFVVNADVNVMQALAMAGGLNPFAKQGKIKILREQAIDIKVIHFDYDAVATGEDMTQNIRLKRGDVIVVP